MKKIFFLSLIIIILAISPSCEFNKTKQSSTLRIGTVQNVNIDSPLGEKNLTERLALRFLHGTLVNIDTLHKSIVSSLVKDWLINRDSSRYILYLNTQYFLPLSNSDENQKRAVTSIDVIGSIKQYIADCKENQKKPFPFENLVGIEHFYDSCSRSKFLEIPLDGAIAADDHTLVLEFYESNRNLFKHLSDLALPIVPYECLSSECLTISGFGFYKIETKKSDLLILAILPDLQPQAKYEKIEILSNLTYERLNQFLTEGTLDMALELHQDFVNIFLESNIQRIQNSNPDFQIVPIDTSLSTFAVISTAVDSLFLSILKKLP
ncbi:MAG TPA: hypothetical protein PK990_05460 [Salinivirgaceae bacterium]|nr:hypothetical protein [Salinivirgaceae bacterium]